MRRQPVEAAEFAFDTLGVGRLTWIGLTLAGIGWALLLGETAISDIVPAKALRPFAATFHNDVIDIAKCIILSGFALAVVGALQSGFGTLNRFFGAVLTRSNQRPSPTAQPVSNVDAPRPRRSAPPIEGRPYRMLPDGSVEVETILGTRLFKTMDEARDFI